MTRISLVFLVLLVWTSLSSANDDISDVGLDDYDVMDDESNDVDDYVDAVLDDEDTFEPSSEEGRKCLQRLIADCMTAPENEGNVEACESLATNLEVSYKLILKKPLLIQCTFKSAAAEVDDLEDLCNVPRDAKAATPGDKKAQKDFDKIKGRLYKVLDQLIKAYERRLALKARQIKQKNKQIKKLNAQIKKLKNKLKYSKNKARDIIRIRV